MPKLDFVIIKQDGKGNMIKQKKGSLKVRSKGEFYEYPLKKGGYDRNKIKREVEEMER